MTAVFGTPVSNDNYEAKAATVVSAPTGIVNGELMHANIFILSNVAPEAPTVPSGWVLAPGTWPIVLTASGAVAHWYGYEKRYLTGETSYSWGHAGSRNTQGVIERLSGIHVATPHDVAPTQNQGTGTTSTWSGLTTVTDGALIVAREVDFADNATPQDPPVGSTPTFTKRLDVTLTYIASGNLATAGPTGDKTHANNNAGGAGPWATYMAAYRPADAPSAFIRSGAVIVGP